MYLCDTLINGYKFQNSFMKDFDDIDENLDGKDKKNLQNAIKDLFEKIFNESKTDIKKLVDLACVVNLRSWFHYDMGNKPLSILYSDLYYKVYNHVYDSGYNDGIFNDNDIAYFHNITD